MTEVTLKKKGEKIACLANFRLVFKEKYRMESSLVKCLKLVEELSPKKVTKISNILITWDRGLL